MQEYIYHKSIFQGIKEYFSNIFFIVLINITLYWFWLSVLEHFVHATIEYDYNISKNRLH